MNKIALMLAVTAVLTVTSFAVRADHHHEHIFNAPRGFDEQVLTIAEIKKNAKDDDMVLVSGRLTRRIQGDKYELTDDNGDTITVELDDDQNWSHLAKDMPILVYAEVDKDLMSLELEAVEARPLEDKFAPDGRVRGF